MWASDQHNTCPCVFEHIGDDTHDIVLCRVLTSRSTNNCIKHKTFICNTHNTYVRTCRRRRCKMIAVHTSEFSAVLDQIKPISHVYIPCVSPPGHNRYQLATTLVLLSINIFEIYAAHSQCQFVADEPDTCHPIEAQVRTRTKGQVRSCN